MDRDQIEKWLERGILSLVLGILAYGPLALGAVRAFDLIVIQALTVLVVILWVLRSWIDQKPRLLIPPVGYVVLLFVVYAIVRYSQADIEYVARQELIKVLIYAALFFVVLNNLYRQESIQIFLPVMVFLAMAISLYALYQFITDSNHVWGFVKPAQYAKRVSGTYMCPDHLAGLLGMILPLALSHTLASRLELPLKVFFGYASAVIVMGLAATLSAMGWISTGVGLVVLLAVLFRSPQHRLASLLCLFLLFAVGLGINHALNDPKRLMHNAILTGAEEHRVLKGVRSAAVDMWSDHRWWGVGPGHFDDVFRQYRPVEVQMRPMHVHNDYLNAMADWGLCGALIILAAWVCLYWGVYKTWRFVDRGASSLSGKPGNKSAFVLGAALALLAILLHSFSGFNFYIPANAILVVCLMALLSGHLRHASERYWIKHQWLVRTMVTFWGAAVCVYLGNQEWRQSREYIYLNRAHTAQDLRLADKLAWLEQAHRVESSNPETTYDMGESLRLASWQGGEHYQELAEKALKWFERGMRLNPYDGYNYLRSGMCLDWLGRSAEAESFYRKAAELDPHSYYTALLYGWHCLQVADYERAKGWLQKSAQWHPTPSADHYLKVIQRKLGEESPSTSRTLKPD